MNLSSLPKKLMDIRQAIGTQDSTTLPMMVIDAQDCVLGMQRQSTEDMRNEAGSIRRSVRLIGEHLRTGHMTASLLLLQPSPFDERIELWVAKIFCNMAAFNVRLGTEIAI